MILELQAGINDSGRRIDRILRKALPEYSLSLIHRLLRQGMVLVNNNRVSPDQRVNSGDEIKIYVTVNQQKLIVNKKNSSPPLPLPEILFQGLGIIFFNKPAGMATHGPNSLADIAGEYLAGTLPHSLSFRPGPLHRLDKPTSGVIAFSTTLAGAQMFTRLLREQRLAKTYLAIVEGAVCDEETWKEALERDTIAQKTIIAGDAEGQSAVTKITPVYANERYSLIEARIVTGRTHQIRAHAAANEHPLLGDKKYGGGCAYGACGSQGFFLHAWKIEPNGNYDCLPAGFPRQITAPLPGLFQSQIKSFFDKEFKS